MGNKVGNRNLYTPDKKTNSIDILGIFSTEPKVKSANKNKDCLYAEDKIFENFDSIFI